MKLSLKKIPCFGVAGNFTGHLEQAGEAKDFLQIASKQNAPKAIFPTYLPIKKQNTLIPSFLTVFPFSSRFIYFPKNQINQNSQENQDNQENQTLQNINLQLEPECGIIFKAIWKNQKITTLKPICFGSSNDCSIRKDGATKISQKKNWGLCSKGFTKKQIPLKTFDPSSKINQYKIASFLVRNNQVFLYGEDSFIKDYSYIYQNLTTWLIEKFNTQNDFGPQENLPQYLQILNYPKNLFVSIGATRYTNFGQTHYLLPSDKTFVILYNYNNYSLEQIQNAVQDYTQNIPNKIFKDKNVSVLIQELK